MDTKNIIFVLIIIIVIFTIMNCFYQKNIKKKIKNYLIFCGELEQEILKSFFKEKEKPFFLTKDADITKKLLSLNIIFIKEILDNQKYNSYILNPLVRKIITKNNILRKKYLSFE
ncbi:Conserved hypothetical protein [Candidatus Phytoplasma australiense]|uniref:Uncharacterized protein n=2 Tax=Phytoplasma australiense TaxID=59748 RepID=B1VA62_PHYAS|nr:hypothetical protein [Candidatus Phytoplasma australiense]AGL90209.1 hypothetical protein SLY_0287 [Strawberry lethal yellows phytoplasma (CPA) str. NZSb11]CAM11835.1 Conserved hypothetical protein [Candidatus Phytoplasma australiense]